MRGKNFEEEERERKLPQLPNLLGRLIWPAIKEERAFFFVL